MFRRLSRQKRDTKSTILAPSNLPVEKSLNFKLSFLLFKIEMDIKGYPAWVYVVALITILTFISFLAVNVEWQEILRIGEMWSYLDKQND